MMKKTVIPAILAIACLVLIFVKPQEGASDYKKSLYLIDGKPTEVAYFGNEVRHDLNDDGREDVAFIGTLSPGGSGTFYYVVAALNTEKGWVGSDGVLLGDRIAPQTTELNEENGRKNVIVVNYADRRADESMVTPPSVGKSIWLKLDPKTMKFGEVAQNFEGESK